MPDYLYTMYRYSKHIIRLFYLLPLLILMAYCSAPESQSQQVLAAGEQLAKKHCGTCHLFPEPALLDKFTWKEHVLPLMALRLGITEAQGNDITSASHRRQLADGNYPPQPLLTYQQWEQIKSYYLALAPESLPTHREKTAAITHLFRAEQPEILPNSKPGITFLKIDTASGSIFAADEGSKQLLVFDQKGRIRQALPQRTTISHMDLSKPTRQLVTHIGFSINPTGSKMGYVEQIHINPLQVIPTAPQTILHSLHRPTQTLAVDLNNDGVEELVTCNYGHENGSLSVWRTISTGTYEEIVIKHAAGALQVIPQDMNGDHLTDLAVLFAQGDEKIVCFINQGNFTFEEKEWLRFPPVYGSSSFELADFNHDNQPDILYTCGDNADYSIMLKPYHGVYIFLNEGGFTFRQASFFPMHGAYKAIANDFDVDGDLDIAAISFFADYRNKPEKSFLYLENRQASGFKSYTLPIHQLGRWMTMDAADIDEDGNTDIVLGNYSIAPKFMEENPHWQQSSCLLYLVNRHNLIHQ